MQHFVACIDTAQRSIFSNLSHLSVYSRPFPALRMLLRGLVGGGAGWLGSTSDEQPQRHDAENSGNGIQRDISLRQRSPSAIKTLRKVIETGAKDLKATVGEPGQSAATPRPPSPAGRRLLPERAWKAVMAGY